jgi:hypothetical protein
MWMRMWIPFEAVWVCCSCGDIKGAHDLGQCSHLHMGSLRFNNIGAAGARDLGAALQVNRTLETLS